MRRPRPVDAWLRDVVRYGERLARHPDGVSKGVFMDDEMVQDAVAKCVEAIGEAAGQIVRLESRFPNLRLSDAYSARNRLSHGYHSVDHGIPWATAMKSIPPTVEVARLALAARGDSAGAP